MGHFSVDGPSKVSSDAMKESVEPKEASERRETVPVREPRSWSYPADLAHEVSTREGTRVHLRPIRPEDASRLLEFHKQLSPRSVYRRYFFVHPDLSVREIEHLTRVDFVDRLALVVEYENQLVAVGRYELNPGTREAEVAFVVADTYQHQGIGTLLLEHLAEAAWRNGIMIFVAFVMAENREMLEVFLNSGFAVATSTEYGIVSVRFGIAPNNYCRAVVATRHGAPGVMPGSEVAT
jgi:GNAT superfamily N-acetyltransferase